ncbi:hypothetical protein CEXT_260281 [Caerostris extrusa]|uniref:HTH CENPB-type domain-containing protein n=1 Tax=Caerostris extrusa TaxID=172846 RepID=A0AAV4VNC8_CAEEX|nr:hypothetical protein CEXT_260281 [Caerostris extrusa]
MNICMPNSWRFNKKAGTDWLRGFVKRHPDFQIIKPEVTTDTGIESNEEKSPVQNEDSIVGGKDSPDDIPLFVQGKEPFSFVYNKQREKRNL